MGAKLSVSVFNVGGLELLQKKFNDSSRAQEVLGEAMAAANAPHSSAQLLFGHRKLHPYSTLAEAGVEDGAVLTMVLMHKPKWALPTEGVIRVSGAGSEDANGLFYPVSWEPYATGHLVWRKEDGGWVHIVYGQGAWWIGHYKYVGHDMYMVERGNRDIPPLSNAMLWVPSFNGIPPAPRVEWADGWSDQDMKVIVKEQLSAASAVFIKDHCPKGNWHWGENLDES